jgi:hypothetical protein
MQDTRSGQHAWQISAVPACGTTLTELLSYSNQSRRMVFLFIAASNSWIASGSCCTSSADTPAPLTSSSALLLLPPAPSALLLLPVPSALLLQPPPLLPPPALLLLAPPLPCFLSLFLPLPLPLPLLPPCWSNLLPLDCWWHCLHCGGLPSSSGTKGTVVCLPQLLQLPSHRALPHLFFLPVSLQPA